METLTNEQKLTRLTSAAIDNNLPPTLLFACSDTQELSTASEKIFGSILKSLHVDNPDSYNDVYKIGDFETIIKKEELIRVIRSLTFSALNANNIKICILKGFDLLTNSAANSLLKFLEEERDNVCWIFLTSNLNAVLPTLTSRCTVVKLTPPQKEQYSSDLLIKFNDLLQRKDKTISFLYNEIIQLGFLELNNFLAGIIDYVKSLDTRSLPSKWKIITVTVQLQHNIQKKILNNKILINKWIGQVMEKNGTH